MAGWGYVGCLAGVPQFDDPFGGLSEHSLSCIAHRPVERWQQVPQALPANFDLNWRELGEPGVVGNRLNLCTRWHTLAWNEVRVEIVGKWDGALSGRGGLGRPATTAQGR